MNESKAGIPIRIIRSSLKSRKMALFWGLILVDPFLLVYLGLHFGWSKIGLLIALTSGIPSIILAVKTWAWTRKRSFLKRAQVNKYSWTGMSTEDKYLLLELGSLVMVLNLIIWPGILSDLFAIIVLFRTDYVIRRLIPLVDKYESDQEARQKIRAFLTQRPTSFD